MMSAQEDEVAAIGRMMNGVVVALCRKPDSFHVVTRRDGSCVMVEVHAVEAMRGRLIGTGGATARALRRILQVAAANAGLSSDLNITSTREGK